MLNKLKHFFTKAAQLTANLFFSSEIIFDDKELTSDELLNQSEFKKSEVEIQQEPKIKKIKAAKKQL